MGEVDPVVVRVIDVPAACTLAELHELVQAAIGWTDSHLHEFQTPDGRRFGVPDEEDVFDDLAPPLADETTTGLRDLGRESVYLYDFGDGWTHDIEVLGVGGERVGARNPARYADLGLHRGRAPGMIWLMGLRLMYLLASRVVG
jgi:hypothetical protein